MALHTLFDPVEVAGLKLRNRTVMAPMTRRFSPGGVPSADVAAYYLRRAQAGVGAIITEGAAIDHPVAVDHADIPRFHGDALPAWAAIARNVKAAGAAFVPQLWHVGGHRSLAADPPNPKRPSTSPSGVYQPGVRFGEPATDSELAEIVAAYGRAAEAAQLIGADAVEIHGAHGYLIDQFLWAGTNARTDRYGGDFARRLTFALEVVRACRAATTPDFPIFFRFSQFKQVDYAARLFETPDELEAFLGPLADAGVDVFDCSQRRFWETEFGDPRLNLAGWTRKLSGRPAMTVGSVGLDTDVVASLRGGTEVAHASSLEKLEAMLARGEVDLVGVGRALLADPDWVAKVQRADTQALTGFTRAALARLH